MKRGQLWLTGLIVAAVVGGLLLDLSTHKTVAAMKKSSSPTSSTISLTPSPTLMPDAITIQAMRDRTYTASQITTERNLGEQGGYSAQVVAFTSDGLKEYAYWAQPDGTAPASGRPVIVLVHGYINPAQYSTTGNAYVSWISVWAKAGFVVVQPDLRGNGLSQGGAVSGHWSPDYTYDVLNLVASLRADSAINPDKIGLVGHSMGGHVALNAAVVSQTVAASMYVNGVVGSMYDLMYNWPNSPAPNDQPIAAVQGELSALETAHGTPKTNPEFWDEASAIRFVNAVKGPVQIDADRDDSVVPYAFSTELEAALEAAHKPVTLQTYTGNDHQLSSAANLPAFLRASTEFWQQILGQ